MESDDKFISFFRGSGVENFNSLIIFFVEEEREEFRRRENKTIDNFKRGDISFPFSFRKGVDGREEEKRGF